MIFRFAFYMMSKMNYPVISTFLSAVYACFVCFAHLFSISASFCLMALMSLMVEEREK